MRTLVTGGGGFLGAHVVARLQAEGIDPIVARRRQYDLTRWDDTERLFADAKPELVVHLAAEVGGIGANRDNPGRYWYSNLMMGAHVIEQSRLHGVDKLLVLGTVCAYPKFAPVPFNEDDLWNGYPEETNAPYGVAKKTLLVGAQGYREQYGLNAIFLLPVNLYGPRDNFHPTNAHVIPDLIRKMSDAQAHGEREVVLWGDGSPTREFLYVDDAAEGIVLAALRYDEPEPVNLGTGEEISIKELAELDRRGDRLRRRDRLGHDEAERPAAAQARHDAREGALRVRGTDAVPRRASRARWRGTASTPLPMRVAERLSLARQRALDRPRAARRRAVGRARGVRADGAAKRLALLPGRRPDVVLHLRAGSSRTVASRRRSSGTSGRSCSCRSSSLAGPDFLDGLPVIILVQVLVLVPVAVLCAYWVAARIGGRLLGYFAAAAWIIAPFAVQPLFVGRYHERWNEQTLPQALGFTGARRLSVDGAAAGGRGLRPARARRRGAGRRHRRRDRRRARDRAEAGERPLRLRAARRPSRSRAAGARVSSSGSRSSPRW